jgi:hypothetical protein
VTPLISFLQAVSKRPARGTGNFAPKNAQNEPVFDGFETGSASKQAPSEPTAARFAAIGTTFSLMAAFLILRLAN